MKFRTILFFIFLFAALHSSAQRYYVSARYDSYSRRYFPKDTNVIVKSFAFGRAAFMIKGNNPNRFEANRVGFIDTTGKIVIPAKYANAGNFFGDYALVEDTLRNEGMIDRSGKVIVPVMYSFITRCDNGLVFIFQNHKVGLMDMNGRVIIAPDHYTTFATPPPHYRNGEGNDVGPSNFEWDYMLPAFKSNYFKKFIGMKYDDKWAVIDEKGQEIIPPRFDWIGLFTKNAAPVRIGKKFGVTDNLGNMMIPADYEGLTLTENGAALATQNKKMGVLSLTNQVLIPLQYDGVININNDAFLVSNGDLKGIISPKNNVVIPIQYEEITAFGSGYLVQKSRYSMALFNHYGKQQTSFIKSRELKTPFWNMNNYGNTKGFMVYNKVKDQFVYYEDVQNYQNDLVKLYGYFRQNKWGLMDSLGVEVTPPLYDELVFGDRRQYLKKNRNDIVYALKGKEWGIIDSRGKVLLQFEYEGYQEYGNGFATVLKNKKTGLLINFVQLATEAKYDRIDLKNSTYEPRANKYIPVSIDGKWGLLNSKGKEITSIKYSSVNQNYNGLWSVSIGDKQGLLDTAGKEIISCIYNNINIVDAAHIILKKDAIYGTANDKGKIVLPVIYDHITLVDRNFNKSGKRLYMVSRQGKQGLITDDGVVVTNLDYTYTEPLRNDIIYAKKDDRFGLISSSGKVIVPFLFDNISLEERVFGQDKIVYRVTYEGKTGIMGDDQKMLFSPKYESVGNLSGKFLIVQKAGHYGLVNWADSVIVPFIYDNIDTYGKYYMVKTQNGYGILNTNGKEVITPAYSYISGLVKSTFIVNKNGKVGFVDDTGKVIFEPIFDNYSVCSPESIQVEQNHLMGLIDYKGKIIYPWKYTFIKCAEDRVVEIY